MTDIMQKVSEKEIAKKAKIQNITEMAISFSTMGRVFEKDSIEKIKEKLNYCIKQFLTSNTKENYRKIHREFCKWFKRNIRTAERKKDGRIIKGSQYASWGQAAKTIDIAFKVYFYYCNLPSTKISSKIVPWLNGAIDTKILEHLKKIFCPPTKIQAETLENIDENEYKKLQVMIQTEIKNVYNGKIFPVQYDDIMWRKFNR